MAGSVCTRSEQSARPHERSANNNNNTRLVGKLINFVSPYETESDLLSLSLAAVRVQA